MGAESAACRVCLKKSKNIVRFTAIFIKRPRLTYLDGFNLCTHLNALISDGLPENLCTHCCDELKAAHRFIEKAKVTDRKLRENIGNVRQTRSSGRRIKKEQEPNVVSLNTNGGSCEQTLVDHGIKTEFINCLKDPLEDSEFDDVEDEKSSEDGIDVGWTIQEPGNDYNSEDDRKNDEGGIFSLNIDGDDDDDDDNDEDDEEDNKPLNELIKKEKSKSNKSEPETNITDISAKCATTLTTHNNCNGNSFIDPSRDFYGDNFPDLENISSDDDNAFNDKTIKHLFDLPTTPEAQIFPHGRYICKICQKTYFTAAGLKVHITVHMPKTTKQKRVRGPNKNKKFKSKKKKGGPTDRDTDTVADEPTDDTDKNPGEIMTEINLLVNKGKDEKTPENGSNDATTEETANDGKKKRKSKMPKPKKMFPCHVCDKLMISASKLRYHMVMHTGEKDYLCTMCPKAYSTIYALKHHMRTHTGERPYECKYCGDKFTRPTTLKSHMRRHTGERPYGCDICGKRFIQHSSMTTHMKLNHMAKTIPCPHCDKKYARQTDLNTHLLSHTGDKPFSCQLCPSRFIRQANLNKHMNQHHSTKNTEKVTPVASGNTALVETPKNINHIQPQQQQQELLSVHTTISTAATTTSFMASTQHQPSTAASVVNSRLHTPSSSPSSKEVAVKKSNQTLHSDQLVLQQPLPVANLSHATNTATLNTQSNDVARVGGSGLHSANSSNVSLNISVPGYQHGISALSGGGGGLPPMLSAGASGHLAGLSTHRIIESVEQLKTGHVDNLTNLLGQVIDQERIGRSVEDILRWGWPHTS